MTGSFLRLGPITWQRFLQQHFPLCMVPSKATDGMFIEGRWHMESYSRIALKKNTYLLLFFNQFHIISVIYFSYSFPPLLLLEGPSCQSTKLNIYLFILLQMYSLLQHSYDCIVVMRFPADQPRRHQVFQLFISLSRLFK